MRRRPVNAVGLALVLHLAIGCGEDRRDQSAPPEAGSGNAGIGGVPIVNPSGGSGGGMVSSCKYPSGPIGIEEGYLVDGALEWEGFGDGMTTADTIEIAEYHDCDGSKGITAIIVLQVALWCPVCQGEAEELAGVQAALGERGVRVLTLVTEDVAGEPASVSDAELWKSNFELASTAVAADPAFTFAVEGLDTVPQKIIINPRDMTVYHRVLGASAIGAELDALIAENQ